MFFKADFKPDQQTGLNVVYYRLVESYRDILGATRHRSILPVGRMDNVKPKQLWAIADGLNALCRGEKLLFSEEDTIVEHYVNLYWEQLVSGKKLDIVRDIQQKEAKKDWQTIDLQSVNNKDVREVGAEWICLQTLDRLGVREALQKNNFTDEETKLALSHIISRAVYPASELKTLSFMKENSAICELTGINSEEITKNRLYKISNKLYSIHRQLENHLSCKTNELFDLQDKIILFDLTNTYFEGQMRKNSKARFGRSKEKRYDCRLIVLGLVVNVEGFIKHSAIFDGNRSDCSTLGDIIDNLRISTSETVEKKHRAIVVIDAGIATEENLDMIVKKGYDYVCVSRCNLKKYSAIQGKNAVFVEDNKKQKIELLEVASNKKNDNSYYLKVSSEGKQLKESSMTQKFVERFEEGLQIIAKSISSKHGTKNYDKVNQRIGRLLQKYPSVHKMYSIDIEKDNNDICSSIKWTRLSDKVAESKENQGVYFIRSSIKGELETLIWQIYNCIREIESSFRCLKTDLELRPVYHKTDKGCDAHLHLALLAYWVVNTIRFQLKKENINSEWREVVRIMNTQKCVTTTMKNDKGEELQIRCCSQPTEKARSIYAALKMKEAPFVRKKSVVRKNELQNDRSFLLQVNTS